ncbi:MAG: hypothetical protein ABFR95_02235 [Actinomycetota bacterium]
MQRACQVVPDIPTFAVDDGFTYSLPPELDVRIGDRVRIRVSGRRLKGYVTAVHDVPSDRKLLPVDGLSGTVPSFSEETLRTLRWAATYYVSPLSTLLKRTVPPNVPSSDMADGERALSDGRASSRGSLTYHVGSSPHGVAVADTIRATVEEGRGILVIAPTVQEIGEIAATLASEHGDRVVEATSSMSAAATTRTWTQAATKPGTILVGTREVMFWPVFDLAQVVVVEDGRRVMKSPGTPTLSVREVIIRRQENEGLTVTFHGPVPTLEALTHGAEIEMPGGRQWPLVEIVDRNEEPPSGSLLTQRVSSALVNAVQSDHSVFVLATSRGYAPAFRCVSCGDVRRCKGCGSAASRDNSCRRCGAVLGSCRSCGGARFQALGAGIGRVVDDISRLVGDNVGKAGDGRLITVGSERDLIGISDIELAVAVDVDGMIMAPHYRASEDALRLLVRLAQTVQRGSGYRCMIQTSLPHQAVLKALVKGRSSEFLDKELDSRRRLGFPPIGSLMAIETRDGADAGDLVENSIGGLATILGPEVLRDRTRWLVQSRNLDEAKLALRPALSTLRAKGAKIRVDVDPIDL